MDKHIKPESSYIELDNSIVTKIFRKIKSNTNLNIDKFVFKIYGEIDSELLNSEDFIDKIKYYRILKKVSQRKIALYSGIDPEHYRKIEMKQYEVQDYEVAEKFIECLQIEDKVELPDYFAFMKEYPLNRLKEIIDEKFGKDNFCKMTGISIFTVESWYRNLKQVKSLSTRTCRKIVEALKNNNIKF